MNTNGQPLRAQVRLVSTSSLWVAGFQGLFGDPCGVEIIVIPLTTALCLDDPEVVLIDSGSFSGPGTLRQILERFRQTRPQLRLIVIGSDFDANGSCDSEADWRYIERLIQAGAKGFFRASSPPEEFSAALQWVRAGSIWAPREVLSRLVQHAQCNRRFTKASDFTDRRVAQPARLNFTPRETEVLRLLVAGRCNREIGESLGIDAVTVKAHLGRIMRKAGVANRIELTMYALTGLKALIPEAKSRIVVFPAHSQNTMS